MAKKRKVKLKTKIRRQIKKMKKSFRKLSNNKTFIAVISVVILAGLFALTFFITTAIVEHSAKEQETDTTGYIEAETTTQQESTTEKIQQTTENTTAETITEKPTAAKPSYTPGNVSYPSDTASWKLICLNRQRYVGSDVENKISLSYVAGSGERMDSRAAAAYEKMYDAAAEVGIYLTPCSGYRSYSTQKRLYYEFVNEYLDQGYSQSEAENLTSKRRNPPGSSEHNIGICMDIICASSSAGFENTKEYKWLSENAADYGFILRYPADKVDVTGVKFEPWHWRYVGTENAGKIKASGLCLEEYLGLV